MEKILVTGANGFLGSNLVRELYRLGFEVKAMVRPSAELKGLSDVPCEIFYGNIDNPEQVQKAVADCKVVVHTAAITDQWSIPFEEYERINFIGTKNIAEACINSKVNKLIYVSTSNTMGPGSKANPGTELNGFTLFNAHSAYITTKYLAQQYILEQVEKKQLPAIVVNPTFMIGPNDVKPSSGKLLLYALSKKVLFYPPGGKNFVYINDVCQGIVNAIRSGKVGDCYLLAGHNLSYREFFKLVASVSGKAVIMIGIPGFVMRIIGLVGSATEKLTGRSLKINFSMAYLACMDVYYSGRKAERELSVEYTPINEAISRSLSWFKENNYF